MSTLTTILDQIDAGTMLLPEFQRGYVWNRDQVRGLMRSLYKGYPVGSLLIWETETDPGAVRGDTPTVAGTKLLLLDGQQRITTLYGVVRGKPPAFFEGNADAFTGLRFNVATEVFEFYAPAKMKDDPRWIDVTELFVQGLEPCVARLNDNDETRGDIVAYMSRMQRLFSLQLREFHQERITGADKGFDVVVDIFNRVNSGGTKLSKGDLALAKICADWPEARSQMREHLAKWSGSGYDFSLDWLLRNANAVATGRSQFSALETVSSADFATALSAAANYVGSSLDTIRGRLGLDHDRVLFGRYAIPVMTRHLHLTGGTFADARERDRWLYWYVHASLWGRFTGSTESVLASDYETLANDGLDGLLQELRRSRGGNLQISDHDFSGSTIGSRFYPMLYLMTRVLKARDLCSGIPLHAEMLGHLGRLQVHHLFPKARLYAAGLDRSDVNAVANFAFLTQDCNLKISDREPEEYFAEIAEKQPGALESQWIPTDPDLWRIDRYLDFLAARRELLAQAANAFLDGLAGSTATVDETPDLEAITVVESDPERSQEIEGLTKQMTDWGYAQPQVDVEITDPDTGVVLAVAEAFWPDGLQVGQGAPVVLELDPRVASLEDLQRLGYEVFTSTAALQDWARRRNREASGEVADVIAEEVATP